MFKTSGLRSISTRSTLIFLSFSSKNFLMAWSSLKNSVYFLPNPNQRESQPLSTLNRNDFGDIFCPMIQIDFLLKNLLTPPKTPRPCPDIAFCFNSPPFDFSQLSFLTSSSWVLGFDFN